MDLMDPDLEDDAEEEVAGVLEELAIEGLAGLAKAPTGKIAGGAAAAAAAAKAAAAGAVPASAQQQSATAEEDELLARLNAL